MTNARISRALLDDLKKAAKGEDFVPDLSKYSFEEIRNLVKNGETYIKDGKLFVNQNGVIEEIALSKEKFLELFPPVLRNISEQGHIGNCWVVGQLDNMITSESVRAGIYKLFRQQGDDIFIKFPDCKKEILFPKGRILTTKKQKQMSSVPGLAMLEQALAVHYGNKYTKGTITNIEKFSKNPDRLMNNLSGINFTNNPILLIKDIFLANKDVFHKIFGFGGKPLQDIMIPISGECVDDISFLGCSAYTRNTLIERLKSIFSIKSNRNIMQNVIDNQANNPNLHIGIGFKDVTPKKYRDLHNMVPRHQLTLKGVDRNTCYISNPWYTWIEKGVDKETLLKYTRSMQVPMAWG